jgi:hypothetical protein
MGGSKRQSKRGNVGPVVRLERFIHNLYLQREVITVNEAVGLTGLYYPFMKAQLTAAEEHYGVRLISRRRDKIDAIFERLPEISRIDLTKSQLILRGENITSIAKRAGVSPAFAKKGITEYMAQHHLLFFKLPNGKLVFAGKRRITPAEDKLIGGIKIVVKGEISEERTARTRNFLRWCFCQGIPVEAGALAAYADINEVTAERIISRVKGQTGAPPAPERGRRRNIKGK